MSDEHIIEVAVCGCGDALYANTKTKQAGWRWVGDDSVLCEDAYYDRLQDIPWTCSACNFSMTVETILALVNERLGVQSESKAYSTGYRPDVPKEGIFDGGFR